MLHCQLFSILVHVPYFLMCCIRNNMHTTCLRNFFLMGTTKIAFVSYAYSINMYFIFQLLVTEKHPVKYLYTFPVWGYDRPEANKSFLFYSVREKKYASISSASCSLFVDLMFFCIWSKFTIIVASDFGIFEAINLAVRPGHVAKFPFLTDLIKVYLKDLKHVACKKLC